MDKKSKVDFYGFKQKGKVRYRRQTNDVLEVAKLGTVAMLGTAMVGITAGVARDAFAS